MLHWLLYAVYIPCMGWDGVEWYKELQKDTHNHMRLIVDHVHTYTLEVSMHIMMMCVIWIVSTQQHNYNDQHFSIRHIGYL